MHVEHDDICNKAECPIAPGDFVLKNTEVLPGFTPPVSCGFQKKLSVIEHVSFGLCYLEIRCYIGCMQWLCYTLKFVIC